MRKFTKEEIERALDLATPQQLARALALKSPNPGGKREGAGRPAKPRRCRRCGEMVTARQERDGHGKCQPKKRG